MYIMQEKPDTHDMCVAMMGHMRQPFPLTQQSWMDCTTPEKKVSRQNPCTMADRSASLGPVTLP
jgi:hypothetical protein